MEQEAADAGKVAMGYGTWLSLNTCKGTIKNLPYLPASTRLAIWMLQYSSSNA
ncbi:hypothetical protein BN1095_2490001 [Clostridioides difficile]|uniref:Uncharacterized protein n=1 Tax=Clostridioides difficile TaxID=1496 RepID=A0A069ASQ8_CLODI|nr:hypothetical protein BN1095_2490001 [Clostridioides difficile]